MEKYLLINIYKLMILMRNDIYNKDNLPICELILNVLKIKEGNESMLCNMNKIIDLTIYLNFFEFGNSNNVHVKERVINILILGIEKIFCNLQTKNYDFAYDMIDALHILPEMLSDGKKINLKHYWKTYFSKLSRKYEDEELNVLKKICTRKFCIIKLK